MLMGSDPFLLIPIFFTIALFYSSAGFGGGSSYLAILSLFSLEYSVIKSTALLCNIVVVSGGTFLFFKKGFLSLPKIWPLIVLSTPMAYLGGRIVLQETTFFILLGMTLLLAAIFMLLPFSYPKKISIQNSKKSLLRNGCIGGGIGFLSGLVGIGGGIFLAPFLHLTHWDEPKVIAATASFFILVNSIFGLIGQASQLGFTIQWSFVSSLLIAVFLGGQIGSRISSSYLAPKRVKQITAILILIVAIRILIKFAT